MNFTKSYFIFVALTLVLGCLLILFPVFAGGIFFDDLTNQAVFFTRICGSTLIGYAALNWLSIQVNKNEVFRLAAWSNLTTLLIATVLSLLALNEFDHNGWLLIVQHAAFALGFICCLIRLK